MRANQRASLLELAFPADERRRLDREVRLVKCPRRREGFVAELVKALRRAQVLQPVITEVAQLRCGVEQSLRCLGEENLSAVACAP